MKHEAMILTSENHHRTTDGTAIVHFMLAVRSRSLLSADKQVSYIAVLNQGLWGDCFGCTCSKNHVL